MWVRKFEDALRLAQEKREIDRKRLLRPFVYACLFTAGSLVLYVRGYRGSILSFFVVSTTGVDDKRFPLIALGLFGFFFALAVYRQRRDGRFSTQADTLLCRECMNPARSNPEGRCQCGGNLEPFEYFDWVPQEATETPSRE